MHGTKLFDSDADEDPDKSKETFEENGEVDGSDSIPWWQHNGVMSNHISDNLETCDGSTLEIKAFEWAGHNDEDVRSYSATILTKYLRSLKEYYDSIHIVAHSHAGNVILNAMTYRFVKNDFDKIDSITTMGTSFFQKRSPSLPDLFGIFGTICIVATVIFLLPVWNALYILDKGNGHFLMFTLVMSAVMISFLWDSVSFFRRRFFKSRQIDKFFKNGKWKNIISEHDEVYNLIKYATENQENMLPRWFFSKFFVASVIRIFFYCVVFVLACISFAAFSSIWGGYSNFEEIVNQIVVNFGTSDVQNQTRSPERQYFDMAINFALSPVLLFLLTIVFLGVAMDLFLYRLINSTIRASLRQVVTGENILDPMSGVTAFLDGFSEKRFLDSDLSMELKLKADEALAERAPKTRSLILSYFEHQDIKDAKEKFKEMITFEELIHNSYYDHKEIRGIIINNIANKSNGMLKLVR